ncbi:response regulator transcription factor [Cellulomonas massiliensis]|uniref:response regulator transcription factor n=1 Tax=Cellulomonas massiliensis TaxID=1465811 RepID=UPI0002DA30A2|nr:response regulator [Cellulomonas massiliensis]
MTPAAVRRDEALERSARQLGWSVAAALVVGAVGAVAVAAPGPGSAADGFRWLLVMLATASVAAILGLIFGVPRARTDFSAAASERYASNSNLEQISDWLTKLLVGAGLVQLGRVPGLARDVGDYLGADLAVPNASAFMVSAVVYGAGVGFGAAYLWTRLRLRIFLERSDQAAAEASKVDEVADDLRSVATGETDKAVRDAAQKAVKQRGEMAAAALLPVLWVDDNPSNNTSLVDALERVQVHVDLARSTEEALALAASREYGVVITDMGRREGGKFDPDAGLTLLRELRASGQDVPVFVYTSARAQDRQQDALDAGATLVTSRPTELFSATVSALTTGRTH